VLRHIFVQFPWTSSLQVTQMNALQLREDEIILNIRNGNISQINLSDLPPGSRKLRLEGLLLEQKSRILGGTNMSQKQLDSWAVTGIAKRRGLTGDEVDGICWMRPIGEDQKKQAQPILPAPSPNQRHQEISILWNLSSKIKKMLIFINRC
jgi:hypothetical protein